MPPQILTFTLGSGAPAGASITANGQFFWTPANVPQTNSITIVVTDNGMPAASASRTFTIIVNAPPQLTGASISGNQFTLNWQTIDGENYQIEYKDNLAAPNWTPLGDSDFCQRRTCHGDQ
ncbi:MAG: putative Ig domain-containing protein [Limisphaerales bacterium]